MSSEMLRGLGVAAMGGAAAYAMMGPVTAFNVFTGIALNMPKSRGPDPFVVNTNDVARKIFSYGVVVPSVSAVAATITNRLNLTSFDDAWQGPMVGAMATLGLQYFQNKPDLGQVSTILQQLPDVGRQMMISASTALSRESLTSLFAKLKTQ